MNYKEYLDKVKSQLQEKHPQMEIKVQPVEKLQGESYLGISVRPRAEAVSVILNIQPFYDQYRVDETKEASLFAEIASKLEQEAAKIPAFQVKDITQYDSIKDRLTMQMVPMEKNQAMLGKIPHKVIGDMATVYRIDVGKTEGFRGSVLITNDQLKKYGISAETLHGDAVKSQAAINPPVLRNMAEVLGFLGYQEESSLWIATTKDGICGAVACQIPDFMEESTKTLGSSFYALPSSVHEMIFLPDDGKVERKALETMVREINRTEVREEDFLSDQVYHYDSQARVFELASTYESRMREEKAAQESRKQNAKAEKDNERNDEKEVQAGTMTVLLVEPGRYPRPVEMGIELSDLQAAVGGFIQVVYPFEDEVGLIMNEEGKLECLPLNRGLYDEDGEMYDVIAGSFLVAGLTEEGFGSLTPEQIEKYEDLYHQPETFVRMGKSLMAVPVPDEEVVRTGARDAGEKDIMKKILRPVEAR